MDIRTLLRLFAALAALLLAFGGSALAEDSASDAGDTPAVDAAPAVDQDEDAGDEDGDGEDAGDDTEDQT